MPAVFDKLESKVFLHDHPIKRVSSDPASAKEGSLIINTTTHEMKVYYFSSWQTLHTLAASFSYLLQEDGSSRFLQEDGTSLLALE